MPFLNEFECTAGRRAVQSSSYSSFVQVSSLFSGALKSVISHFVTEDQVPDCEILMEEDCSAGCMHSCVFVVEEGPQV